MTVVAGGSRTMFSGLQLGEHHPGAFANASFRIGDGDGPPWAASRRD